MECGGEHFPLLNQHRMPRILRETSTPTPTDSIIGARMKTISSGSLWSFVAPS